MFQCYYEIYIFVNDLIQFHWFILIVNSYYKLPVQQGVLSIFMYIRLFIEIFKRGACQYWIAEAKKILIIFFIARNSLKIFKKDIPQRKKSIKWTGSECVPPWNWFLEPSDGMSVIVIKTSIYQYFYLRKQWNN